MQSFKTYIKRSLGKGSHIEWGEIDLEIGTDFDLEPLIDEEIEIFEFEIRREGVHVLAWYISPLDDFQAGGIHFSVKGMRYFARWIFTKINDFCTKNLKNLEPLEAECMKRQILKLAFSILLNHEQCHYAIDKSMTGIDFKNIEIRQMYNEIKRNLDIKIDESICNANVLTKRKPNVEIRKLDCKKAIEDIIKEFMDMQPRDYGFFRDFLPKSKFHSKSTSTLKSIFNPIKINNEEFKNSLLAKQRKNISFYFDD